MSDQAPEAPDTQGTEETQGTGGESPWASYLNDLPEGVRPLVEPAFREWDANTTKKFQSIHTSYEPLKPYKEIQEAGWSAEELQQAIQLASALNENPESVYQALVDNYGFGVANAAVQGETGLPDNEGEYVDPRFAQLESQQSAIADFLLQQENTKQAAIEDQKLVQHFAKLKEDLGDYDEDYVATKMYSGMSGEDAVRQYQSLIAQAAQNRPNVPVVMGSGGGLPSQSVNPAQMTEKDRKALITQMLSQANQP